MSRIGQDEDRIENLTRKTFTGSNVGWPDDAEFPSHAFQQGISKIQRERVLSWSAQALSATACICLACVVFQANPFRWRWKTVRQEGTSQVRIRAGAGCAMNSSESGKAGDETSDYTGGTETGGATSARPSWWIAGWLIRLYSSVTKLEERRKLGEGMQAWSRYLFPGSEKATRGCPLVNLQSEAEAEAKGAEHTLQGLTDAGEEVIGKGRIRSIPRHVAIIMDGNRRYGKATHGDPLKGHADGGRKLGQFLEWCTDEGVEMVTAYAFSTENWKRDPQEVSVLMELICKACRELMEDAVEKNMCIKVLMCHTKQLPERVLKAIREAEEVTRFCNGLRFNICLSYGGRQEITHACKQVAAKVASGVLSIGQVDEALVEQHLLTAGLPDPDVLIRTSGERRVSNFLLYQLAYTELFFVEKYWPEVTREDLAIVIKEYQSRERRYGC
ncbi:unnamed protein product [Discosporangium mesarthrocarpum]